MLQWSVVLECYTRYGEGGDTGEWEGNLFVFDDRMVVPIDGVR